MEKKVREKSREYHNHKPQPFPDPKRKRKPTNSNKHKPDKRTKSTKISSLFPKRGNRNTKRTEKHKNKMTHGKTYNKKKMKPAFIATLVDWLFYEVKQRRSWLVPGWVAAVLDFVEDPVSRYNLLECWNSLDFFFCTK